MKKFRFMVEGLAGDVFYDQHQPVRGSVLFLYGFPSFVGPNQVVQESVSAGHAVISPHYYGTYDSDGLCSVSSMIQTVADTEAALTAGRITKIGTSAAPVELPPISIAIGHSLGTAVLTRSAHMLKSLRRLLLLAPTIHYGTAPKDYGMRSDGREGYFSTSASHPRTYRLDDLQEWTELLDGRDEPRVHDISDQLEAVDVVVGELDPYFDVPVAADMSVELVQSYLGPAQTSCKVLPGVAHGIDELLSSPGFSLADWLRSD